MTEDNARQMLADTLALGGKSAKTIVTYGPRLSSWWRWAIGEGHDPCAPTPSQVAAWSDTLSSGESTRQQARSTMSWWCRVLEVADVSAAVRIPERGVRKRRSPLSRQQAAAMLEAADRAGWRGHAVYLGVFAGLRVSEIAMMRWDGIDLDAGMLRVLREKGDDWHHVPLSPVLAHRLAPQLPAEGWVFPGRNHGHIGKATVWQWIKDIGAEAGHPGIQPHDLRRTGAKAVYEAAGKDIIAAKDFLGHQRITTTMIYLGTGHDAIRSALAGMDLGAHLRDAA